MKGISQADSTRGRSLGPFVVSYPYRRVTPGGCSRDFEDGSDSFAEISHHMVSRWCSGDMPLFPLRPTSLTFRVAVIAGSP